MKAFVCLALLAICLGVTAQDYYVGFANEDITPSQEQIENGEVWMGGYGFWRFRGRPEGVHDPIWARAFVIGDNATRVAVAVLDAVGVTNRILKSIRAGVAENTGIPIENVLISCTHTHSGPDLQGLWGYISDAYREQVIEQTIAAITTAHRAARPARLFISQGNATAGNRRDWGYTDTTLLTLDVRDAETNDRLGAIVNFAAHPTTLGMDNLLFSSDYCHYVRTAMEENLRAPIVYINGIIGDASPKGSGDDFERSENYGREIATAAIASMANAEEVALGAGIGVVTLDYNHQVTNPLFLLAFAVGLLDYDINDDNSLDTRASYFRLGSRIQGVAFPGESLTRNGLAIKDAMAAPYKFFLGLNGDTLGYFIPSDEWRTGRNDNYEEMVSIDKWVGDVTRDHLVSLIQADNELIKRN